MDQNKTTEFGKRLASLINEFSLDTEFSTPDFILAQHMMHSATVLRRTLFDRETWFGSPQPPDDKKETADGRDENNICARPTEVAG